MKYNMTLDFMALALQQAKAGNHEKAAKCLLQASREADADDALRIIEHSNGTALQAHVKAVKAAASKKAVAAKKAVKAEAEEVNVDDDAGDVEFDESILDEDLQDGDEGAEDDEEAIDVDAATDDEGTDEEEGDGGEDETEAVAKVMASFFAQAAKQVKANKTSAKKPAKK